ncbi:transposase [Enterococcus sp. DIV0213h]|uniref:transposase n=1 Tax=Enterococcus sp. DIV0213h TaxID=2774669 RepID=UPI003F216DA0
MNDSIKKMLRIAEKDLMITEVSYETLQKKKTLLVDTVLSPTPRACRSCGSTVVDGNGKAIIVKNGKIEAKNTHIKTMKRVSYGFKSFENMRIRIFLINQLIKVR